MWFLKGRPTKLNVRLLASSVSGGYQGNNLQFSVESNSEKLWLAIPFPWAPHKEDGGLKWDYNDQLSVLEKGPFTKVSKDNVEVYSRFRDLKYKDIELSLVQDLINWHLDDVAVITMWVTPGTTYRLCYLHKIASDSALFVPTRLPVFVASQKPEIDYKIWTINARTFNLPKQLVNINEENTLGAKSYKFTDWNWDEDTRFSTCNWDSSDDESLSETSD